MSSAPTVPQIARDSTWLAQALDWGNGLARLIEMDRQAYRSASFLDDRMLLQPVNAHVVEWQTVRSALAIEARRGVADGFAKRYGCKSLVWFELHETMESAILREKQLKAGSRTKKLKLIEAGNREWRDLWEDIAHP